MVASINPTAPHTQTFEQFQELIRDTFINGSGIDPELFDACVEFHQDVESTPWGDVSTPIHDLSGQKFVRFGHQCKDPVYAAFLKNEDGTIWQYITSVPDKTGRPYSYLAPPAPENESGDRIFTPPIPASIREKIGQQYNIDVPIDGSFWDWVKDCPVIPRGVTEGAKKSLCALSNGFVFLSLYGCNCGKETETGDMLLKPQLEAFATEKTKWILALDRDTKPKTKKLVAAAKRQLATALHGYGCYVNDTHWKPSQGKGLDDFIVAKGADKFRFIYQLSIAKIQEALGEEAKEEKLSFCQLAFNVLYSDDDYICAADKLYKWEGSYYKLVSDGSERRRIKQFCDSYSIQVIDKDSGKLLKVFPYAKTSRINEALEWAKQSFHVDLDQLNPPGLNCLNGILQITWDADKPSWELIPHSPDYYFTYAPLVEYNPKADTNHCDRLLDALDKPQRDIFLKVIAASLDLPNVRRYKGRLIRALLLRGTGSNGKDALREAISTIFGKQGLTSNTLSDFAQYDDGRRFPLSNLVYSRINWASENTNSCKLDRIQSLKAAITGNPLVTEAKGKDGQEFTPNAVFLFNINDVPNMQGSLEAILSRYGVIDFKKTFKINADTSKGELEADPRFAYDPMFLRLMVCPSLLNRLLDALQDLMINGIDYICTQDALQDIQSENSHLFQFAQDTGMGYTPNAYLSATDIWEKLEQWYQDNGTLTYEETSTGKMKAIWQDQVRLSDRNCKAPNQVLARFKQLFPKAKMATVPHPNGKKSMPVLQGLSFSISDIPTPISDNSTPIPPQFPPQQIVTQQDFHPNHPQSSNTVEEKNENNSIITSEQVDNYPTQGQKNNQEKIKEENVDNLGVVGVQPLPVRVSGVDNWGATGVEDNLIGVEDNLIENNQPFQPHTGDVLWGYPTLWHWENKDNPQIKDTIKKVTIIAYDGYSMKVEYREYGQVKVADIPGANIDDWVVKLNK
jgi:phage/plasmid-associated DNA primase